MTEPKRTLFRMTSKMHFSSRRLVILAVVLACGLALAALATSVEQQQQQQQQQQREDVPERASQVKLFDFANYKQIFRKSYSSVVEELTRMKYFMSGALRAFASMVNYKFRRENHFLAVNHMSDYSQNDIDTMDNKLLAYEWEQSEEGRLAIRERERLQQTGVDMMLSDSDDDDDDDDDRESPEFMPDKDKDLLRELRELVAAHANEPEYRELAELLEGYLKQGGDDDSESWQTDVTQAVSSDEEGAEADSESVAPRDLPLERLINSGQGVVEAPEVRAKVRLQVPSDNPDYKPLELLSNGLVDEQLPVDWRHIPAPHTANPVKQLGKFLNGIGNNLVRTLNPEHARLQDLKAQKEKRERNATEVYVDLRQSNCMLLPRFQGKCGACYAFAAIAIMEYLRCKQTGQLVPLSEQYMIDCGGAFVHGIGGCGGGSPSAIPVFTRNFGLHLRTQYPYKTREEQCPYDEQTPIKETGYLRAKDFSSSAVVPIQLWPEALKHGPLMVAMGTGREFKEYGGGVWSGKTCTPKPSHAVLVVGHGREDNVEYWLIRNSHGTTWGEQGYMKLDKKADCIFPQVGYAFGVTDPKLYHQVEFDENNLFKAARLLSKSPKSVQIRSQFKNIAKGFGGGGGGQAKKVRDIK